jgi:hypothetical protein
VSDKLPLSHADYIFLFGAVDANLRQLPRGGNNRQVRNKNIARSEGQIGVYPAAEGGLAGDECLAGQQGSHHWPDHADNSSIIGEVIDRFPNELREYLVRL